MIDRDMEIARELFLELEVCKASHKSKCFSWDHIASALRRVRNEEAKRYEKLVESLRQFKKYYEKFSKRQHELLIEGQNLESASESWDKFPEAFSLDLGPIFKAIDEISADVDSSPSSTPDTTRLEGKGE